MNALITNSTAIDPIYHYTLANEWFNTNPTLHLLALLIIPTTILLLSFLLITRSKRPQILAKLGVRANQPPLYILFLPYAAFWTALTLLSNYSTPHIIFTILTVVLSLLCAFGNWAHISAAGPILITVSLYTLFSAPSRITEKPNVQPNHSQILECTPVDTTSSNPPSLSPAQADKKQHANVPTL